MVLATLWLYLNSLRSSGVGHGYAPNLRDRWVTQKSVAHRPMVRKTMWFHKVSRAMFWDKIRKLWEETNRQHTETIPLSRGLVRERGQSLVEFAVILPVLLLLVLGTVDLGMGFKTYIALTNAAREGVRWITIHPSDQAGAKDRIAEEAIRVGLEDGLLVDNGFGVSFSPDQSEYAAGDKVTVNVSYEYEMLFGAITGLSAIPFTASSTMVVLYDE